MRLFKTITFSIFSSLLFWGCFNQEFDYKENHPLYIEHNHEEGEEHVHTEGEEHNHDDHEGHEHEHDDINEIIGKEHMYEEVIEELENKDRVIWQKPDKVIQLLGDLKGKTVADIGAGTGYFSFRLADEAAKVIAVDIDKRAIHYMDNVKIQFPEVIQERVDTRLATAGDPNLSSEETDAVILVNVYSYITGDRIEYFKKVIAGMKSGGKLLIVDYKKRRLPEGQGPPAEMRLAVDLVESELETVGYRLVETDDTTLEYQYIVLMTKP